MHFGNDCRELVIRAMIEAAADAADGLIARTARFRNGAS
jgi:hypothetical protein